MLTLKAKSGFDISVGSFCLSVLQNFIHVRDFKTNFLPLVLEGPISRLFGVPIFRARTEDFPRERDGKRDGNGTRFHVCFIKGISLTNQIISHHDCTADIQRFLFLVGKLDTLDAAKRCFVR